MWSGNMNAFLSPGKKTGPDLMSIYLHSFRRSKKSRYPAREDLQNVCEDLKDDMINENGTGVIQEYMEWLTYMLNMDASNRATFLKET